MTSAMLVATLLVACGERAAVPMAPSAAEFDKQAIAAATERERRYQAEIASGHLDFIECSPGTSEAVRLVDMDSGGTLGYSLAITADAHGAVAIWQGIQRTGAGKYQAYGPKGMRLDGNGWRQVRQALTEDYVLPDSFSQPPPTFLVTCLAGERTRVDAATEWAKVDRIAVAMRRLAGNYYSPPAHAPQ
jgi:hypothetical protein